MYTKYEQRLNRIINSGLTGILRESRVGLEKETLRVRPDGSIAHTPHPASLGSALTNPYITTDYSEALIEFITPPLADMLDALSFLRDTQKYVYSRLEDETLWATSMPCVVAGETSIPVARYGNSNIGTMKTVYRRGLGYRYGRVMQVIAGVHFNYSLDAAFWAAFADQEENRTSLEGFTSDSYFAMIRNMQRYGWLIPYLFGASPAVCKSFLGGKPTELDEFDASTYYDRFATSLRMGDIGYQNNKEYETGVNISYDSLDAYTESLIHAIETPCPEYERYGVIVDGEYQQLNCNLLQIENEYYSTVRPKTVLIDNEKPTSALRLRGVEYVELRSLDVNAFDPMGINEDQLLFLEAFMLFCLFQESPPITMRDRGEIDANDTAVAHRGREPGLKLRYQGRGRLLREWAAEVCSTMEGICAVLDEKAGDNRYSSSLKVQQEAVQDPDRTPSARMLAEMRAAEEGFFHFARRMSEQHYRYFIELPLDAERERFFTDAANDSVQRQREIEESDDCTFDEYLEKYFAQS